MTSIDHLPTRDGYERWAEIYDGEDNPLIALEELHIAGLLGEVRGQRLLDLGCGTGRHALRWSASGATVVGVDFSPAMLAKARAKPGASRVQFVQHDLAEPLPFPEASFDHVVSGLVLDHIRDLTPFFAEIHRVVKPSGCAVLTVMHPALKLLGVQARFTDPSTGRETRPSSAPHEISDYVLAAVRAGLALDALGEHRVDEELATRMPRAVKYLGWPLLLTMRVLRRPPTATHDVTPAPC